MQTPDVTREEVEKPMMKLKNGEAAGNDNIAAELQKNGVEAMIDWVTELVQEVWRTKKCHRSGGHRQGPERGERESRWRSPHPVHH